VFDEIHILFHFNIIRKHIGISSTKITTIILIWFLWQLSVWVRTIWRLRLCFPEIYVLAFWVMAPCYTCLQIITLGPSTKLHWAEKNRPYRKQVVLLFSGDRLLLYWMIIKPTALSAIIVQPMGLNLRLFKHGASKVSIRTGIGLLVI
jgi:hypothetical protein